MCSFIKMLIYMNKNSDELSVSSRLGELYKGKVHLGNPKVVAVAYGSFSLQSLSHSSNGVSQRWS